MFRLPEVGWVVFDVFCTEREIFIDNLLVRVHWTPSLGGGAYLATVLMVMQDALPLCVQALCTVTFLVVI